MRTEFKIEVIIHSPRRIVWQAFTDPENMLKWSDGLYRVETVKGTFGEIGAVAHLHFMQNGRSHILEDRLEQYEQGKRIVSRVTGGGLEAFVETTFHDHDDGTGLVLKWSGKGRKGILRLVLPFLRCRIKMQALKEFEKFRYLVEEHGAHFR